MKRLGKEEHTVSYGITLVENAIKQGAVERIVIADTLLRESFEDNRLQLDQLMKQVEPVSYTHLTLPTTPYV